MSNEYIFFTDQTALTFRICLVFHLFFRLAVNKTFFNIVKFCLHEAYETLFCLY